MSIKITVLQPFQVTKPAYQLMKPGHFSSYTSYYDVLISTVANAVFG